MASTYSDLKIELIGTGEQVGTWGATTNTNLGTAIEEAITGSADVSFSSADVTLTLTNTNTTQAARNLRLVCTGTSGGARNLILGSGCQIEKIYLIQNDLADAVTVKNTTGTGVAVPAGAKKFVFNDGTNVVEAINVSLTADVTGVLPILNGGTGGADASTARTNLGLGTIATQNSNNVSITGGSVTGITDLAVADGGTGASDASGARTNLGLGSLATLNTINNTNWSGTDLAVTNGGTGASDASGARTNLGLGSLATANTINNSNWSGTDLAVVNGGTGASDTATARTNLDVPSTTGSGASGTWNISISGNAANGGVTSLNGQTGAITNTALDAIGSYAILHYAASTPTPSTSVSHYYNILASGTTIAGSSLRRSNLSTGQYIATGGDQRVITSQQAYVTPINLFQPIFQAVSNPASYQYTVNSTTMSGTWRLVGGNAWSLMSNVSGSTYAGWCPLLWVRIS